MKNYEIVNKIHSSLIIYLLLGGFFPSQREFLVLFLPTLQFQFLINDNTCVLTQLENKLIKYDLLLMKLHKYMYNIQRLKLLVHS